METAALNRGMGRSSYTMQTLANQGDALAKAVQQLTEDSGRRSQQIQNQITQAAQQNSRTQGRLKPACGEGAGAEREPAQGMEQQLSDGDFLGDGKADDGKPADDGQSDEHRKPTDDRKPDDAGNERNDGRKQHGEQRNERIDDDEQGRGNEQKEGNGKQSGGKHTRNLWTIQPEEHE